MSVRPRQAPWLRERIACGFVLAPAALGLVWITAELSSWLSVPGSSFVWDRAEALALLRALLPIAVYTGAAIAVLMIILWLILYASRRKS